MDSFIVRERIVYFDSTNLDQQILKGRLYTTQGDPVAESRWNTWMASPSIANAEAAITSLRAVFAVFNYMNAISHDRQTVETDIMNALTQFDDFYARVRSAGGDRQSRTAPCLFVHITDQIRRADISRSSRTSSKPSKRISSTLGDAGDQHRHRVHQRQTGFLGRHLPPIVARWCDAETC
jgi:hypothetical protein